MFSLPRASALCSRGFNRLGSVRSDHSLRISIAPPFPHPYFSVPARRNRSFFLPFRPGSRLFEKGNWKPAFLSSSSTCPLNSAKLPNHDESQDSNLKGLKQMDGVKLTIYINGQKFVNSMEEYQEVISEVIRKLGNRFYLKDGTVLLDPDKCWLAQLKILLPEGNSFSFPFAGSRLYIRGVKTTSGKVFALKKTSPDMPAIDCDKELDLLDTYTDLCQGKPLVIGLKIGLSHLKTDLEIIRNYDGSDQQLAKFGLSLGRTCMASVEPLRHEFAFNQLKMYDSFAVSDKFMQLVYGWRRRSDAWVHQFVSEPFQLRGAVAKFDAADLHAPVIMLSDKCCEMVEKKHPGILKVIFPNSELRGVNVNQSSNICSCMFCIGVRLEVIEQKTALFWISSQVITQQHMTAS